MQRVCAEHGQMYGALSRTGAVEKFKGPFAHVITENRVVAVDVHVFVSASVSGPTVVVRTGHAVENSGIYRICLYKRDFSAVNNFRVLKRLVIPHRT